MEEMATLLTIGAQEKLALTSILQRHPELKSLGAAIRWAIRQAGSNPSIEGGGATPFVPEGPGPFIRETGSVSFSDAYDFGHLGIIPKLEPGKYSLKKVHESDKSVRISLADLKWQTEARELVTDIGALRFMGCDNYE
jgi:hypothetical protein